MSILALMLALSFVCGFAFTDPIRLAMRREDEIDYAELEHARRPVPTLAALALGAALWQTLAAAVVFAALLWCVRLAAPMGVMRYLVLGLFTGHETIDHIALAHGTNPLRTAVRLAR